MKSKIFLERKRSKECLEKQAKKMMKLSNEKFSEVDVGRTVRVPIPDVDRARCAPRNVLAVVTNKNEGFYTLGKKIIQFFCNKMDKRDRYEI